MKCYLEKIYCQYYHCAKVARCHLVLTNKARQAAIDSGLPVAIYSKKPECFVQDMDYQDMDYQEAH